MNKNILLILCLMFSLTLVSAETGYGCPQEINFTEVINNSGNIEVVYETSCVSSDDVLVGISVFNELGGSGSNCPKLNTTYENNSYHITTACTYPEYNENLTFKVSLTCPDCTPFPATLEINNTPVVEEEPEVVEPIVKKKKSSSRSKREVCEEWSICIDGTQTQSCSNGRTIKSRTCESEVIPFVGEQVVETTETEVTEPTIEEGFGTPVEETRSYAWAWWLFGIIVIIAVIVAININKN